MECSDRDKEKYILTCELSVYYFYDYFPFFFIRFPFAHLFGDSRR